MAPPRRAARRRSAAAAAESPRRLSVRRGEPFKREAREGATAAADAAGAGGDDDGLPLSDEALLLVFSALSAASADLVRCAATCRCWRRLVSADAAFICCRSPPPRSDPFIRNLALGLFLTSRTHLGAPPTPLWFVPLSAAAASRHQAALAAVAGGASRVLASRAGRLVLDLRRRANSRTTHVVRLGVCDPVTGRSGGGVDVLPTLRGKDSPTGPFACTVITAADEHGTAAVSRLENASSYRVLLLYNRRSFTALRCYSSDAGGWGPEAQVVGARIGRSQLRGEAPAAVVHHGVVLWPRLAVALRLDSLLQPAPAPPPAAKKTTSAGKTPPLLYTVAGVSLAAWQRHWSVATGTNGLHRLLGVMPDGELLRVEADLETIRAYWGARKGGDGGGGHGGIDGGCLLGEALKWKWTMKHALMGVHAVRLRWIFEKSGLFIFTARDNTSDDRDTHVYAMDVETKRFQRVATGGGGEPLLMEMCGYEMDRVALLASLGGGQ